MTPDLTGTFEQYEAAEVMIVFDPGSSVWEEFLNEGNGRYFQPRSSVVSFPKIRTIVGTMRRDVAVALDKKTADGSSGILCFGSPPPFRLIRPGAVGPPVDPRKLNGSTQSNLAAAALGVDQLGSIKTSDLRTILVGHLDSGVFSRHRSLEGQVMKYTVVNLDGTCKDDKPENAKDKVGHGTHTAGIIAGLPYNGNGYCPGIAGNARLLSAVVSGNSWDEYVPGTRLLGAVDWAIGGGAQILNMSIRVTGYSKELTALLQSIRSRNVIPVCASGNRGKGNVELPASLAEALSVGESDNGGYVTDESGSAGPGEPAAPDVIAPGQNVLSCNNTGGFSSFTGTSQGAAHISGLAALLWGACPTATMKQIETAICLSASLRGADSMQRAGAGIPNAPDALLHLPAFP